MVQRKQHCLEKVRCVEHTLRKLLPTIKHKSSFCRGKSQAEISLQLNHYFPLWMIKARRCWQSQGWKFSLFIPLGEQMLCQMMHLHLTLRLLPYLRTPCFQLATYHPKLLLLGQLSSFLFPRKEKKHVSWLKDATFFSQEAQRTQYLLHERHQLGIEKDWEAKGRKSRWGRWKRM